MGEQGVRATALVSGPHPPRATSVRTARHEVEERLAERDVPADAIEDVGLVVAELAANAVLHARSAFTVGVEALPATAWDEGVAAGGQPRAVRVVVADSSAQVPVFTPPGATGMSGRGLALVQLLATGWGVELRGDGGKAVWAELDVARPAAGVESSVDDLLALWTEEEPAAQTVPGGAGTLPAVAGSAAVPAARASQEQVDQQEGLRRITVPGIPAAPLLAAKEHMDDLLRELQLMLLGGREERDPDHRAALAVASRLDAAARAFAAARTQVREQVARAVAEGAVTVDLELVVPSTAGLDAIAYGRAVEEAAGLAGSGALLTTAAALAGDADVRRLYLRGFIEQFDDYDS